jgi:hypothetical protein
MGTSKFTEMHFDLNDLIQLVMDPDELIKPFTKEEIDNIVKNRPSGKSPGPYSFYTGFSKKC